MIPESQTIPKLYRKWYQDRKWSPYYIGPQMIPERKLSPFWTAYDPEKKVRNGMEGGMVWIEN